MRSICLLIALVASSAVAFPCDVVTIGEKNVDVAKEIFRTADVIVRATAVDYVTPPPTGKLTGKVHFNVDETLRGTAPAKLVLSGELVDHDDFNNRRPPYQVVRPNGLAGTCYAWQYRAGAQYLLLLKKSDAGELSADWYALGPTNEQLHSADDPWLIWVRNRARH